MRTEPLFTLTFTTCKRLDKFEKTLDGLVKNCKDIGLVSEVLIVDDNSGPADVLAMKDMLNAKLLPLLEPRSSAITVYGRTDNRGHFHSIKYIFDTVKSTYLFFMEDDWDFIRPDNYLSISANLLDNANLDYVGLRNFICPPKGLTTEFSTVKQCNGIDYVELDLYKSPFWPGYSFNPHVCNWNRIKNEIVLDIPNRQSFEHYLAWHSRINGIRMGFLTPDGVRHGGEDISAYTINQTNR